MVRITNLESTCSCSDRSYRTRDIAETPSVEPIVLSPVLLLDIRARFSD
jgi:hypothetical protein